MLPRSPRLALLGLLGLAVGGAGCDAGVADGAGADAVHRLVRASVTLRGTRPSVADLRAVAEDPARVDALIDGYIDSDAFGATIRDLHAAELLLRSEAETLPALGALAGEDELAINHSLVEEPLQLIAWIVREDLPYPEILTTDLAVVDARTAAIWGVDPVSPAASAASWLPATWSDGRPAAGILASSGLWWRIESNGSNYHRARANRITRMLICEDFLERDLPVDSVPFTDARAVADAIRNEPQCQACHDELDPIAAVFFPFDVPHYAEVEDACPDEGPCYPLVSWFPELAGDHEAAGMPEPAWFGTPVADVGELGRVIAEDPRLPECTARRLVGWFAALPPADVPQEDVDRVVDAWGSSGGRIAAMARVAIDTDTVRRGPPRATRPEQWSRMFEDLTGFIWTRSGFDRLTSDIEGFRSLAGGLDHAFVTRVDGTTTPTQLMVQARAAEVLGQAAAEAEVAERVPGRRRLLTRLPADVASAGEDTVRAQLAELHLRLLGELAEPAGASVDATWRLFRGARTRGGEAHAWGVVFTAMLGAPEQRWH